MSGKRQGIKNWSGKSGKSQGIALILVQVREFSSVFDDVNDVLKLLKEFFKLFEK
jgi:hypothetical protein